MELIARSELPKALEDFGMKYTKAGVEAALRAVGAEPARYQGIPGGKGRISLFDPIVVWLIVAVWESNKRRFSGLDREIGFFRELHKTLSKSPDAKWVPGFEDEEAGAQLLMLTSPLYGLDPREIRRITFATPQTLEYSLHGRKWLVNVLQAYNNVWGSTVASLPIDPKQGKLPSRERQLRSFAEAWLHEARMLFEMDEYNAGRHPQSTD